jgi:hypothetical protein
VCVEFAEGNKIRRVEQCRADVTTRAKRNEICGRWRKITSTVASSAPAKRCKAVILKLPETETRQRFIPRLVNFRFGWL